MFLGEFSIPFSRREAPLPIPALGLAVASFRERPGQPGPAWDEIRQLAPSTASALWQEEFGGLLHTKLIIDADLLDLEAVLDLRAPRTPAPTGPRVRAAEFDSLSEAMLPFQGLFLNPTSDWDRSDLEFLIAPAQSPSCPPRRSVLFPALDMHLNEVFEEISYRLSDSPRPREPEMLELCFPVAICDDSVTFLEALAIPKLEFRFFPALSSEPLSPEWLAELALPNDEAFLRFHFEPALAATFELAPPLARIEEVLSPVAVNGIADKERSAAASCRSEKVLKVEPLRRCLFVNTCHFSSDDITEFASLFPKSDVRAARLESGVLMQMGIELIVVWAMGDTPLSTRELIDWWLKYDRILIVSPLLPPFAPVDKIKWRCIISMGQISSAVLPFLVESDEQNRN